MLMKIYHEMDMLADDDDYDELLVVDDDELILIEWFVFEKKNFLWLFKRDTFVG